MPDAQTLRRRLTRHNGSHLSRVAMHFIWHPHEWLDARQFLSIGGLLSWGQRVRDCRNLLGMKIENRVRHVKRGTRVIVQSEYRYCPRSAK